MIHVKSVPAEKPLVRTTSVGDPMPASAPVSKSSQRFFHLDALRASLMFWGILVHASTVAKEPAFRAMAEASGLVRMEAFFVISGFLAYMLLKKYGALVTVRKRLVAIGLPFVTALTLLNPVTNWLVYNYHNPPIPFGEFLDGVRVEPVAGPINWHLHLWFLVALFVYSILAPVIQRAVDVGMRIVGPKSPLKSGESIFLAMAAAVVGGCIGARVVFEYVLEPWLPDSLDFVTRSVGNYLPFYALGMLLFAAPRLRVVFSQVHWIQTILSCVLLAGAHELPDSVPNLIGETLVLAAQTYVAICLSSLLFWGSEKWVGSESKTARSLSESAYTVYLFHFLVLYLCAFAFRDLVANSFALLCLISAVTFVITLGIQHFVIRKVALLELLFNGKTPRRVK